MDSDHLPERIVEVAYLEHAGMLRRRITAITRDPDLGDDLTHEAFVRLMIEVSHGQVPDDIGAWLGRVGHNLAMSQGRRKAVAARHRGALVMAGSTPSPESVTLAAEDQRVVCAALARLGETDRRALIMAAHGYPGPEIARSIGRTDAATRTLLCRARAKIRERVTTLV